MTYCTFIFTICVSGPHAEVIYYNDLKYILAHLLQYLTNLLKLACKAAQNDEQPLSSANVPTNTP